MATQTKEKLASVGDPYGYDIYRKMLKKREIWVEIK
jgi:hypothetical protein